MNKKLELLKWMKRKEVFATHEVVEWGMRNYYLRADRTKRDFQEQGLIRKLGRLEKECKGYTCKDDVYKAKGEEILEYLQPSLFKQER
jgi:hypothetical protein